MDSSKAKTVSLTIARLPSSSSPGLRELTDIPAGQQVRVLARANERLLVEKPSSSEWETSNNVLAYKRISHSLTSGIAEGADTTIYPFQASFHSNDERNRSSVPFYISLRASASLVGAWFLQSPGVMTVKRQSHPTHVSAFPLSDGQTWIGLASSSSPTPTRPTPIHALLTCNLNRPSGCLYTVTLAQGSLRKHTYSPDSPTPASTIVFSTASTTHNSQFSGSKFPSTTHEVDSLNPTPSLPLASNTGFHLSPADANPSVIFSYSMLLRTYVFHLSSSRDSVPTLLDYPLEHGFSTTVSFDPASQTFLTSDSEVIPLREHADMLMPRWTGNIVLPEFPDRRGSADSAESVEMVTMMEESSGTDSEEGTWRRKLLLQMKERGQAVSAAGGKAPGFGTPHESARWEREVTVGRDRGNRTRANV